MADRWLDETGAPRTMPTGRVQELDQQAILDLAELRHIYENAPVGLCMLDRELRYLRINKRLAEINGLPVAAHINRSVCEIVPSLSAAVEQVTARILATDGPVMDHEFEGETAAQPGARRYWNESWFPVRNENASIIGFGAVVEEITERRQAEQHRQLLISELNHRVNNTLAVVQAIARQSFGASKPFEEMLASFEGRLSALSAAHERLSQSDWQDISLADLIQEATVILCDHAGRIRLEGPPVVIDARKSVTLALALHELCTNALKYGALSVDTGTVDVHWSLSDGPLQIVRLIWRELGGPPVEPPKRVGHGLRIMKEALQYELEAKPAVEFRREGLVWSIETALPVFSGKPRTDRQAPSHR